MKLFAPVTRLEAIRILLAYACPHNIKLFQMDVKSAFLNGKISELVYIEQPPGFEDPKKPNLVYKLSKVFYGLKQAPRAWYERLKIFLFLRTSKLVRLTLLCSLKQFVRICLFVKFMLMILSLSSFCEEFGEMMSREFEMSMIGELSFFLGLQIK